MSCQDCDKWGYLDDTRLLCCWKAERRNGKIPTFPDFDEMNRWAKENCDEPESKE